LLGIAKGDKDAMHRQYARNFGFFDAPVRLIFTVDRRMTRSSWVDYGMFFMQNIMLATVRVVSTPAPNGLGFIPGHPYRSSRDLKPPDGGMRHGSRYADKEAAENRLRASREPVRAVPPCA
jgi:hypothetical protein